MSKGNNNDNKCCANFDETLETDETMVIEKGVISLRHSTSNLCQSPNGAMAAAILVAMKALTRIMSSIPRSSIPLGSTSF